MAEDQGGAFGGGFMGGGGAAGAGASIAQASPWGAAIGAAGSVAGKALEKGSSAVKSSYDQVFDSGGFNAQVGGIGSPIYGGPQSNSSDPAGTVTALKGAPASMANALGLGGMNPAVLLVLAIVIYKVALKK